MKYLAKRKIQLLKKKCGFSRLKPKFLMVILIIISSNVLASQSYPGDKIIAKGQTRTSNSDYSIPGGENERSDLGNIRYKAVNGFNQNIFQRKITGTVKDNNGNPLIGATIQIKNTLVGTITDVNGYFELRIESDSAVLIFSSIGFEKQEIPVGNNTTLNIVLQEEIIGIKEIVVTALGISRRAKSLVYATQKVDATSMQEIKDPNNILNSLSGKVVNAMVTQSSGGVGSGAQIILRGNKSIQGSNSALIVVDGVPLYNSTYNNGANTVSPDEIESISVLRGASAAALYGSQAGNGVILITTKKGQKDKFSVDFSQGVTFESPFVLPMLQNEYGQGTNGFLNATVGDSWGAKMEGQSYLSYLGDSAKYSAQPNNIKDFFANGINSSNTLSLSGGTEKNQFYLSYGNTTTKGIIPNNKLDKNNFDLRVTSSITKRLSLDTKFSYYYQKIKGIPRTGEGNTPVMDIYQIPRNVSTSMAKQYQTINNIGIAEPTAWPSTVSSIYGNPYWAVNNDRHDQGQDHILGFINLKYKLFDWLSLSGRANIDRALYKDTWSSYEGTLLYGANPGGNYIETKSTTSQKWMDIMFEGNNNIGEKIVVNYQFGGIYRDTKDQSLSVDAGGLNITNKFNLNYATTPITTEASSQIQIQSLFGTVNLAYNDYLFLEGTFRNDWDSRLPSPHSFQYYSSGISAIISDIITLPRAIPFLKFNFSYAEVGNGGQFALLQPYYLYQTGTGIGSLYRNTTYPFPDLKPEIVRSLESTIDAKFVNNRIGLTVTVYKSNSFNQLITIDVPYATGYTSRYINAGNIQNKGLEFTLYTTPIIRTNFKWNLDFNYSLNRNKVIELTDEVTTIDIGYIYWGALPQIKEGGSYGDLTSYRWATDDQGNHLVSASGKPVITNQLGMVPEKIGNYNPKGIFGISNMFTYKQFYLSALISGRIGGIMISGTEMNLAFSGITEITNQYREGDWVLGGVDDEGNPVDAAINSQQFWQTASNKRVGYGEFFAYDITNLRFKQLSVGYNIPVKKISFIENARISFVANNLCWLYRGKSILDIPGLPKRKFWFDPDVSIYNGNAHQGVEYGAFPSTRSIGYNLSISF